MDYYAAWSTLDTRALRRVVRGRRDHRPM